MKKLQRTVIVLLTAALAALMYSTALPRVSAAYSIIFTAVNDQPLKLTADDMAVNLNGVIYVPYTVFHNTELGTSVYYSSTARTIQVMDTQFTLRFDMSAMKTYDNDGGEYNYLAVMRNNKPYLPVKFVCDIFGLKYSELYNTDLGYPLVRISGDTAKYSDEEFVSRAGQLFQIYLSDFMLANPTQSDAPHRTPPASPSPTPRNDYSDVSVSLVFYGADYGEDILTALDDTQALFFLTAAELRDNADFVRHAVGTGRKIGVVGNSNELAEALAYLREAAAITTELQLAELPEPLAVKDAQAALEVAQDYALLNMRADADSINQLTQLLREIRRSKYNVRLPDASALFSIPSGELQ